MRTRTVLRTRIPGKKTPAQQLPTKLEQSQDAPRKRNKSPSYLEVHSFNTLPLVAGSALDCMIQRKSQGKKKGAAGLISQRRP
jgi:hypothetical protein